MDDEFDKVELRRIIDMMNRRGHAPEFAADTIADRQALERDVVARWAAHLLASDQANISAIRNNPQPNGVPDCFANYRDREIGIEVTELVDRTVLDRISEAAAAGVRTTAHDALFDYAQWDEARFRRCVDERIDDKHQKYSTRHPPVFVEALIIHTAEPWLSPFDVERWLSSLQFMPRTSFGAIYVLMSYHPGYPAHPPVFKIAGSLA